MYRWETDKDTYLKLKTCLYELHPEINVELLVCDNNLELLGFIKSAPCIVSIDINTEQRENLMNELMLMETDAVDNEDIDIIRRAERYVWIWDVLYWLE